MELMLRKRFARKRLKTEMKRVEKGIICMVFCLNAERTIL